MKVIIIEDEYYAAEKLQKELIQIDSDIEVLTVLDSCDSCLGYFKDAPPYDLIFSDIHLADGICFNVLSEIEIKSPIIFTTAYDKYALDAFETNGIDYLLKPIQPERLEQAIGKFKQLRKSDQGDKNIYTELKTLMSDTQKAYKSRFLCKLGNKIKSIPSDTILFFYSRDKMTFIVDKDGSRYPINHTLDDVDGMMNPFDFFKLNRKYVIHFDAIDEIHPHFKGRLKLKLHHQPSDMSIDDAVASTDRSPLLKAWLDR